MKTIMSDNIVGIDAENFVIKVFDAIKCAAASYNGLTISLTPSDIQSLAEHIKAVDWIEINEGSIKEVFESCQREES